MKHPDIHRDRYGEGRKVSKALYFECIASHIEFFKTMGWSNRTVKTEFDLCKLYYHLLVDN